SRPGRRRVAGTGTAERRAGAQPGESSSPGEAYRRRLPGDQSVVGATGPGRPPRTPPTRRDAAAPGTVAPPPTPTRRRPPRPRSGGLADRLPDQLDLDLPADQHPTGVQRHVPHQAVVGAVDLGGGPEAEDVAAVGIATRPGVRHVQVDRAGDPLDG